MLVGALARDLLLELAHGIPAGRATEDIDLAVAVDSWPAYDRLKTALITGEGFRASAGQQQRIVFDPLQVDIVPFGPIERPEGEISWPPDNDVVMHVIGFEDVYENALSIELDQNFFIKTASLAGLVVLKLIAWSDRRMEKDAHDITVIAGNYLDAGNHTRWVTELPELLEGDEFDHESAGARLVGKDIAGIVKLPTRRYLNQLLATELDESGSLTLVQSMARSLRGKAEPLESAISLLSEIAKGLHTE
jgi:predicted nucleotidyltransferase